MGSKRPVTAGGTDDPELEAAVGDEIDDRLGVVHLERDVQPRVPGEELAQEHGHDDCRRPGRSADRELARERALAVRGDLVQDLLLELQQPLGTAKQAQPGLGRLDAAARTVEQLRAQPLLERPHLQRDRRLRDAQALGGLGEAAALDDLAEGCKLACIHKQILSRRRAHARCGNRYGRRMKVWIDMTNSPHVPFFRPLLRLLEERGHEVRVSARDFAQTLELLSAAGIPHEVVGPPHGGAGRAGKIRAMGSRLHALRAWARPQRFDLALSHASHELPLAARTLGIRSAYAYDYEFARAQHTIGSRAATRVVVPAAIPQERLDRLGAHAAKVRRYPGLKEEYYLAGFQPDESVLAELGLDRERVLAVVRTPPEVSLYHRHGNPLFTDVLERLGSDGRVQAVVLPRTPAQREKLVDRIVKKQASQYRAKLLDTLNK